MKVLLVSNTDVLKNACNWENVDEPEQVSYEKSILSCTGEDKAKKMANLAIFSTIDKIYASNYVSALSTAKYIARRNNIKINVDSNLDESKIGILNDLTLEELRQRQFKDLNYKLRNGESLSESQKRLNDFILGINDADKTIVVVTHEIAILSFLMLYCEAGYNYENELILSYHNVVIDDGVRDLPIVFEVDIEDSKINKIKKLDIKF